MSTLKPWVAFKLPATVLDYCFSTRKISVVGKSRVDRMLNPLPNLQCYFMGSRQHLYSQKAYNQKCTLAGFILRIQGPVPRQWKGKVLSAACGRDELYHSLEDLRKEKQIE